MNFDKLTEYINSLDEKYGIKAADCKITQNHRVVYRHMTGHSDYEGIRLFQIRIYIICTRQQK